MPDRVGAEVVRTGVDPRLTPERHEGMERAGERNHHEREKMASQTTVIKGGHVVDPATGIDGVCDVEISDGRIEYVGEARPVGADAVTFDASRYLVLPGIVDIHAHFYHGVTAMSVNPGEVFPSVGTTVAIDAGTAGAINFHGLRTLIIDTAPLDLYAFVNINWLGMVTGPGDSFRFAPGVDQMAMIDVDATARVIAANRDRVIGVKVLAPKAGSAHVSKTHELVSLAVRAAEESGTKVMVHVHGGAPLATVLSVLRPGDILTHAFHSGTPNILDDDGRIRPEVREARERGVIFDFAPGDHRHFGWSVLETAAAAGIWPDTLSSDFGNPSSGDITSHARSPEPFASVADCMSMLLHTGLPLVDVVRAATSGAAEAVGLESRHGSLQPGRSADITLLELVDEPFTQPSMGQEVRTIERQFRPGATMVRGAWLWQRAADD